MSFCDDWFLVGDFGEVVDCVIDYFVVVSCFVDIGVYDDFD